MSEHIFISYKSQQRDYAYQIHDALRDWGLDPWLDEKRLQPGGEWGNEIDNAIKTCQALVGIMTPQSMASRLVTNEWDLAIMEGKLFIPLMFEITERHYKYVDIQYIDFSLGDKSKSFDQLKRRLTTSQPSTSTSAQADPYHDYLRQLYERVNRFLSQNLITSLRDNKNRPEPIRLRAESAFDAIEPLFEVGGPGDTPQNDEPQEFDDFIKAFAHYDGRVLLLGEPGAGKTITLMHHTRDAIVRRRQDQSAPLPILAKILTWDAERQPPMAEWLSNSLGAPSDTPQLMKNGKALLLLDGLDELGGLRKIDKSKPSSSSSDPFFEVDGMRDRDEYYDPRQRFLQNLPPNNQVLITCRVKDYLEISEKAHLNGAITLKRLDDTQLRRYLHAQPELYALVQSDLHLREWLSTPLLLSFFAFAYEGMNEEGKQQLGQLATAHELREFIFNKYVEQRYKHEEKKRKFRNEELPYTLDQILTLLGDLAISTIVVYWKFEIVKLASSLKPVAPKSIYDKLVAPLRPRWDDEETAAIVPVFFSNEKQPLIDLASTMNLLQLADEQFHFPHLLLRNHFAYGRAIQRLLVQEEKFETEAESGRRISAIIALGELRDPRAIPFIEAHVKDKGGIGFGYHESTSVGDEARGAIMVLKAIEGSPGR